VKIVRSKEVFANDEKSQVNFNHVLRDVPRYDFCNRAQEVVDRLRALDHKVIVYFQYYYMHNNKWGWSNKLVEVDNPIEYAYNTDILLIWITIKIVDHPPKKWWKRDDT